MLADAVERDSWRGCSDEELAWNPRAGGGRCTRCVGDGLRTETGRCRWAVLQMLRRMEAGAIVRVCDRRALACCRGGEAGGRCVNEDRGATANEDDWWGARCRGEVGGMADASACEH